MPKISRELLESMSDEELIALKQRTDGEGGSRFGRAVKHGLTAGLKAAPSILLEGKMPTETTAELSPYEKERQKLEAQRTFERPKRVGLVHPITGEITETETEADVVLKGVIEKPEEELTPSDLINIYKILATEPAGEVTGGRFGIGGKRGYTPEQEMLRTRARELLERKQGAEAPIEPTEPTEPTGKDEFGYIIGEEATVNKKRYKYIGNNQWQEL